MLEVHVRKVILVLSRWQSPKLNSENLCKVININIFYI